MPSLMLWPAMSENELTKPFLQQFITSKNRVWLIEKSVKKKLFAFYFWSLIKMINDTTFFYIFFYKVGKTIMVCFKKNKVFFTLRASICGESGIRTHGTISDTHAFQACSFSHSDISPIKLHVHKCTCSLIQFLVHLYTCSLIKLHA